MGVTHYRAVGILGLNHLLMVICSWFAGSHLLMVRFIDTIPSDHESCMITIMITPRRGWYPCLPFLLFFLSRSLQWDRRKDSCAGEKRMGTYNKAIGRRDCKDEIRETTDEERWLEMRFVILMSDPTYFPFIRYFLQFIYTHGKKKRWVRVKLITHTLYRGLTWNLKRTA